MSLSDEDGFKFEVVSFDGVLNLLFWVDCMKQRFIKKTIFVNIMFRVFRSEWYKKKLDKLDNREQVRVKNFEQSLKVAPYTGQSLGYNFFREKKFDGKRLIFLVYEEHQVVFLVTITDKKAQQQEIDLIKSSLDVYKEEITKRMSTL